MKIEDVLRALPSKEDIASAVGLEARSSETGDMLTGFAIFGTGMILVPDWRCCCAPKAVTRSATTLPRRSRDWRASARAGTTSAAPANPPSACTSGTKETSFTAASDHPVARRLRWLAQLGYHNYGYGPSGIGGIILIVLLILFLTGRLNL